MAPLLQPGTLLIDSSTIDPMTAQWMAQICQEKNFASIDAPVSGGTPGAQAGTLTFMVGTNQSETFDKAKPILDCMGKNIVNCGKSGMGQGSPFSSIA
jgi:3-hydroxyisobutyrate dehydrogenase